MKFHQKKIRVIFDIVINHINNSLIRDPLNGSNTQTKFYKGTTPWGPKPRFESVWVQKYIADSLIHLIREYRIDGFRFDMTDSIFNGSAEGYQFLQNLTYLIKQEKPDFYLSAEQLPNNVYVSYPLEKNGLGFDSQWNDRFKNFFELQFDHYRESSTNLNLFELAQSMIGFSDHYDFNGSPFLFGSPLRTVNYLGSHDFIGNKNPFLRIITGYNASEKVGSNQFSQVNPLEENKSDISPAFRKIHNSFSHAVTRLAYGLLFTKPGATLFYQGEEVAQDLNIENEWSYMEATEGNRFPSQNVNIDKYVRSHRMPWSYLDLASGQTPAQFDFITKSELQLFKGHFNFFKKMIEFKKQNPEINLTEAINVNYDNLKKILVYELKTKKNWYYIVANFSNDLATTDLFFPGSNQVFWNEIVNSTLPDFGGENSIYRNVFSFHGGQVNKTRIIGPGFYLFKASQQFAVQENLYLRSSLNNWKTDHFNKLFPTQDDAETFSVKVTVPTSQKVEFKVANQSWDIEFGKSSKMLSLVNFEDQTLSYRPFSANAVVNLSAGDYIFTFNFKTFKYQFIKQKNKEMP